MGKLNAHIRKCSELARDEIDAMFELYRSYYDAVSLEVFREDLAGKSHVVEMLADGQLRGFSTLALMPFELSGTPQLAIFSGDTIIHQDYWGEQALVAAFCRFAGSLKAEAPSRPLFWFLISKGYRTYRYLGLFAKSYFPHHLVSTPDCMQERINYLARTRFDQAYDPEAGLIRFPQSRGHLKSEFASVRNALDNNPAVQFFMQKNPLFHQGEEVACLVELSAENLRSFARRSFTEGLHVPIG